MDPISALFATYLDMVSSLANETMTDRLGTELQVVVVQHKSMSIPYSYQSWNIREQTVCDTYRQDFPVFSRCTVAAQSLIQETCDYLQANPQSNWKHRKLENMYCYAALTFQPKIASVEWSGKTSPVEEARAECNTAVAELMSNQSAENLKRMDKACDKYHALRDK